MLFSRDMPYSAGMEPLDKLLVQYFIVQTGRNGVFFCRFHSQDTTWRALDKTGMKPASFLNHNKIVHCGYSFEASH